MTKVKCAYCGKMLKKEDAYAVRHGKVNKYYCNFEHSIAKKPSKLFYEKASNIIGQVTNTAFYKEMNEIAKVHGFEKMSAYLDENEEDIRKYMSKDFNSTYAMIRYFAAILKNNLDDFTSKKAESIQHKEVEVEMYDGKYKPKKERVGMDDILKGLLNDN